MVFVIFVVILFSYFVFGVILLILFLEAFKFMFCRGKVVLWSFLIAVVIGDFVRFHLLSQVRKVRSFSV